MLHGNFKEGQAHKVNLRGKSTQALELATKQIFNGNFVLPARYEFYDHILDLTIGFLRLADYLDLLGPLTASFEMVKTILVKDRNILEPRHIKEVMKIPDGNQLRELIVKTCVARYIESIKLKLDRCKKPIKQPFKFNNDLTEIKNFRGDLFKHFNTVMHDRSADSVPDSLSGTYMLDV